MLWNSKFLFLLGILGLSSCIEPYEISIGENEVNKYVVSGLITDEEGYQYLSVSIASGIDEPKYLPLDNCQIQIIDDKNNKFSMEEFEHGEYRVWMNQENLLHGTSYYVKIITPAGVEIESNVEQMTISPDIDSIYYLLESKPTNNPNIQINGIQFYVDVDLNGTPANYLKWDIEETWEYWARFARENYYDGEFHQIDPPDNSTRICWMNKNIEYIFTLSLGNYGKGIYKNYPLHFVDNTSNRLVILYSLLIRQYSLSENAFVFWEQMKSNSSVDGGLYEQQPIAVKGNLKSSSHPSKKVLGYFGVSSVKEKRMFIEPIPELELNYIRRCGPSPLTMGGWKIFTEDDYPVYYVNNDSAGFGILALPCVDCTIQRGTLIKPDYWPR